MYSAQKYHMLINDFSELDLRSNNYNYYQHNINLSCYIRQFVIDCENELGKDFSLEKKSVVSYLRKRYYEVVNQIKYYNKFVKTS